MEVLLTLGGAELTSFGVKAAGCLLVLFVLMAFTARFFGFRADTVPRFAVTAVPLTFLMSRLTFVLASCTYYLTTLSRPDLALHFWDGGYSLMGALSGLMLAALLTARWEKKPAGQAMDWLALTGGFSLCLMRLSEAGTGMGVGRPIELDWMRGISLLRVWDATLGDGTWVYAVYRMEAVCALLIAMVLCVVFYKSKGRFGRDGDLLLLWLTLLGATQVVCESLRNDGFMVTHFVRINQVLALLMLLTALTVWVTRLAKVRGSMKGLPLTAVLVSVAAVALGVVEEFRIDSSEHVLLDYAVMKLCMAAVAVMAIWCQRKSCGDAKLSA